MDPYGNDYAAQVSKDVEHVKLLAIFYYVWGGLTAFFSLFTIIYIVIGIAALSGAMSQNGDMNEEEAQVFGLMFLGMGSCGLLIGVVGSILTIMAGRRMSQFRSRVFCLVMAGLSCLSFPLGTALGIFTFIVLGRPTVIRMFEQGGPPDLTQPVGGPTPPTSF